MDDATVEILLQIKEQGQQAFTEASAGLNRVREALDRYREAQAAGAAIDDATKRALGDLMDRSLLAGVGFAELKNQVTDARQALTHYSEAVLAGMPEDAAQAAVLADLALQYQEVAGSADDAAAAEGAAGTSAAASGGGALAGAGGFLAFAAGALAVVYAVQLLLPPLLLVIGALAVLTSFTVAGAGMIALLGAIGVAIGGLGAATVGLGIAGMGGTGAAAALATATANLQKAEAAVANAGGPSISVAAQNRVANAQRALNQWNALHQGTLTQAQQFTQQNLQARLAQAQQGLTSTGGPSQTQLQNLANAQAAYNAAVLQSQTPISKFLAHLTEMGDDFEKAAIPIATMIIQFGDKLLPGIERAGMGIMRWFGQRVPGILQQIAKIFKDLGPDIQIFSKILSDLFDRNESKIAPMAEAFIRFGLGLTTGLLSVLEQLSNWFLQRLPTYGPIVNQIFGAMGAAILGIVSAVGHFADYVVANWRTWTKEISDAWNNGPAQELRDTANTDLPQLKKSFEEIMKQAPVWVPVIGSLASAFLNLATALLASVSAGEKLIALIQKNPWLVGPAGVVQMIGGTTSGATSAAQQAHNPNKSTKKTVSITVNVNANKSSSTKLITQV